MKRTPPTPDELAWARTILESNDRDRDTDPVRRSAGRAHYLVGWLAGAIEDGDEESLRQAAALIQVHREDLQGYQRDQARVGG